MSELEIIQSALREDVQDGDHTSLSCIPKEAQQSAQLLIKQDGVLAGIEVAGMVFQEVDPELVFEPYLKDGDTIKIGDIAFRVRGSARSILTAERLALNFMQRMSGIATHTRHLCEMISGTKAKLLDTRKTTPNLRIFEKKAVLLGGGYNHRHGLYDMIMIKDNHIDFAGGIPKAIEKANEYLLLHGLDLKIEIEARDLEELEVILECGNVDRIMLDNFSFADLRTAVEKIDGRYETEASGGITEDTIRDYAECGVDYISVGALTHQIKSLDMSLKAE